ncbi:ADP-glyceromanno-heptose 6-epimerase [Patescibacteria group bacterium]
MLEKNKRIIVTGGAGFIGANIVKGLNEDGYKHITIVDQLTNDGRWKNLADISYDQYFDKDDFLDRIQNNTLGNVDVIIHIGACSSTVEVDENFLLYNNTIYSKELFDYCTQNNCRFIYASSAATYGNGDMGYDDNERNLKPMNCYGYSKHLFDQWVLDSEEKPRQWAGLKFFNVYGPYENHKGRMASMVYHGYNQIVDSGKVKLFKSHKEGYVDGGQKRDFVYIKDVVNVVSFFLNNPDKSGIFNVGTGKARTFLDMQKAIFAALNKEPNIKFIDIPEDLQDKYQYYTEADITNLRSVGYQDEFYSLEDGVKDYVQNYLHINN